MVICACCGCKILAGEAARANDQFHVVCMSDNGLSIAERRALALAGFGGESHTYEPGEDEEYERENDGDYYGYYSNPGAF